MMVTWPEVVAGGGERSDVNVIWGKKLKDLGKQRKKGVKFFLAV